MSLIVVGKNGKKIKISKEEEESLINALKNVERVFLGFIGMICEDYEVLSITIDPDEKLGYIHYICDGELYVYVIDVITAKYKIYHISITLPNLAS